MSNGRNNDVVCCRHWLCGARVCNYTSGINRNGVTAGWPSRLGNKRTRDLRRLQVITVNYLGQGHHINYDVSTRQRKHTLASDEADIRHILHTGLPIQT